MTEHETDPGGPGDDSDPGQQRVRRLLASAPAPTMPPEVVARLDDVLAEESRRRRQSRTVKDGFAGGTATGIALASDLGAPPVRTPRPRPVLVTADVPATRRWQRPAAIALVAAVTAAAVGIAGYTLSAAAGLNEPVATSIVRLQSADLAREAETLAAGRNLSAHLFSSAWRCSREVTDGRITGIAPAYVDGTPALLVYTRTSGQNRVTVVTGCPGPDAVARESVQLP